MVRGLLNSCPEIIIGFVFTLFAKYHEFKGKLWPKNYVITLIYIRKLIKWFHSCLQSGLTSIKKHSKKLNSEWPKTFGWLKFCSVGICNTFCIVSPKRYLNYYVNQTIRLSVLPL